MREVFLVLMIGAQALAQIPETNGGGVRPGTMKDSWLSGGRRCLELPDWQVREYNPDFFILRESGCVNYEKPFLYLLFGSSRALLLDTGAGKPDTAGIVTTIADSACGYAAYTLMPPHSQVLSVEFKVNLLRPAKGDLFRAQADVIKAGRTLTVVRADVLGISSEGESTLVATMLATIICLRRRAREQ